ncbi:MAG: hypothetical protein DMG30_05260 [Acidobacteria bacterium]|nr:MAG: hypothetical protein DMG30_05260 [Acidobacteriota bacterium]
MPPRSLGSRGTGTLIFYQAAELAAWTQLPLLRREPRDSKEPIVRFETPKSTKGPPLEDVAIASEAATRGTPARGADMAAYGLVVSVNPGWRLAAHETPEPNGSGSTAMVSRI